MQDLKVGGGAQFKMDGRKPAAGETILLTPTLSYASFSAFSEEELGFVLRGFIALNNGESLSPGNLILY